MRAVAPLETLCSLALAVVLSACAGVSPRPGERSPDDLPRVDLSAGEREHVTRLVDQCVRDVVLRRYAEAERAAVEALAVDPRAARARAVRGIVLLQVAKEQDPPELFLANEGEAEVVLAEELAPNDPFVGWVHALFLAESGHLSAAAEVAEAALKRTPDSEPEERAPLFGLAGTYRYELGEERAARPLLEAYLLMRPDDAGATFRLGSCLLSMAALPIGPESKRERAALSLAEQAAGAFMRCSALAPGDEDAALAVGAARLMAADLAATAARKARSEERAELESRSERHLDAAVEQFRSVARRFPESAEAMFRVGVAEERRGRPDAARTAYLAALERDGEHLGALLDLAALLAASEADAGADEHSPQVTELLRTALRVGGGGRGLSEEEERRVRAFLGDQVPRML